MDQPALVDLVETALQNEDIAPLVSGAQTFQMHVGYNLQGLIQEDHGHISGVLSSNSGHHHACSCV